MTQRVYSFLFATFFAATGSTGSLEDAENLVLAHDEVLFTVDFDLLTTVLTEEDAITSFNVESLAGSVFLVFSLAGGNYFAFLGFFLGSIGDNNASSDLLTLLNSAHNDAVVKGSNVRSHT
jgi:hypothetical protein